MSLKRASLLLVALVSAGLVSGFGVSWACDHQGQQAAECGKDKPGCAKAAEAVVVNGAPTPAAAPCAGKAADPVQAVEAMAPAAKEEAGTEAKADAAAPCPHAAAAAADGKGHPCASKGGKPCPRMAAEAKAQQPADSGGN